MTLAPVDLEAAFVTFLNAELTPPVSTRVPNPRPASHVRVQVVGGTVDNIAFESPRLLVECWAATQVAAVGPGPSGVGAGPVHPRHDRRRRVRPLDEPLPAGELPRPGHDLTPLPVHR